MNWTVILVTLIICGTFLATILIGMRVTRKAKESIFGDEAVREFLRPEDKK